MGDEPAGTRVTLDGNFEDAATLDNASEIADGVTLDSPTPVAPARIPSGARPPVAAARLGSGGGATPGSLAVPKYSTPRVPRPPSASAGTLSSSDAIGGGRFVPGQIIADRYRIVALAGRGGMGEVYRAEDLKLSQIVAIKFLPESVSKDAAALARFHAEVRIARTVSHPNVCRMFDIGDMEGITFLTMEYVDGEDLSSLVRRIGRLSTDKAAEIARQMCAGLAAAHDKGVIHRDLKPANIMLDGAGKVRITDFGLAGIAATIEGADVRAGTPAYMAPEQLAGKEVTIKSDIYSLGLILYEIITGKRAFDATTLPELMRMREDSRIPNPSTLVRDIDPLFERVILRCLATDPVLRPASALQVSAALPGGDPLAAALAAGETPSPEMVAAAGENDGIAPRVALTFLAAILVGTLLLLYFGIKENALERVHPSKSPEVLSNRASELIAKIGYPAKPVDREWGFSYNSDFIDYASAHDKPHADWSKLPYQRPELLSFWYRQSRKILIPDRFWGNGVPGVVTFDDPPMITSGMVDVWTDDEGRLGWFQAIPDEKEEPLAPGTNANGEIKRPDWSVLFAGADIDPAQLKSVPSTWNSLAASDYREAWEGKWPGNDRPLHVEAASLRGKPVYFALSGPWTNASRMPPPEKSGNAKFKSFFGLIVVGGILLGGLLFAFLNLKRGRGDRVGARRLAWAAFILEMVTYLFRAHFALSSDLIGTVMLAIATSLLYAGAMWSLYIALEPYVRRNWPQTIISWTRLVSGKVRDPLVGRDIVSGVLLGMSWVLILEIGNLFYIRLGGALQLGSSDLVGGFREAIGYYFNVATNSIQGALAFFLLLVLIKFIVRNQWLALAIFVAIELTPRMLGSEHVILDFVVWTLVYGIAALAVVRFGLIALGIGVFLADVLLNVPYSLDFSNWYAAHNLVLVFSFFAIGVWGFYLSLGGNKLVKPEFFDR
ncbi:MAG TPA: serine/threonine-protein kinase [Candidatus Sulfotelmatobacter sp.]|nr:serine/threonine-protein kinase [Candidatus Sulfotelmatobacter sp.]